MASGRTQRSSSPAPKLAALKAEVLTLAGVSTTAALKRANAELRALDFRRKASWLQARELLQPGAAAEAEGQAARPEEFRELFAEIDAAAAAYGASIDQGLQLSSALHRAADALEQVSEELLQDAGELERVQRAERRQRRARQLN
jgi:hypothetical protein